MVFPKYSIKFQIILGIVFGLLNFLFSVLCTQILQIPLFMDMIFVYAGSFIGLPCGIIVGLIHNLLVTIVFEKNILHLLYVICCITGTILTRISIRHENFNWIRLFLLIFVSTVLISFEGSLIYYLFFSENLNYKEEFEILFITYSLVTHNIGIQLSAFLARLPVNLIDKTIAVLAGFWIYAGLRKIKRAPGNS